jgi:hypothetical protein
MYVGGAGSLDRQVVVYKVDRLTQSLTDFAKMVDVFDGAGVSFVSVTQAFNTTSSMGRLTLNVLLSFAQFEREVTAERIRDKVAASKRKGMWMGGAIPLGYDVIDKALVVNPRETTAIRTIFAEYLALGSVRQLSVRLAEPDTAHTPIPVAFEIPFKRRQNGRAKPTIIAAKDTPQQDPDLITLVADARRWAAELLDGKVSSALEITDREGLRSGTVSRILPLAWLAPDISTAILEGHQPLQLSAKTLRDIPELPLDWVAQRQILGFARL